MTPPLRTAPLLLASFLSAACDRATPTQAEPAHDRAPHHDAQGTALAHEAPPLTAPGGPVAAPAPAVSASLSAANPNACAPLATTPRVETRKLKVASKYRMGVQYPALVSSSPAIDKEIAAHIEADLRRRQREFDKSADEAIADSKSDPEGLKPDQVGNDIKCQETLLTASLLSMACTAVPALGGPYPNLDHFAYSFQLCADDKIHPLRLADVCRGGPACTKVIAKLVNQGLKAGPAREAEVQVSPQSESLKKFAITPKGLRFFANEELPHALDEAGTIDVPFAKLKLLGVLNPDGPLATLLVP